jgi:hypothetical protein
MIALLAILLLYTATCPPSAEAQGGPPLLIDDTGTPGAGIFEINLAITAEKRDHKTFFQSPLFDLNYGIGEQNQFTLDVPWLVVDGSGANNGEGLGKTLMGWKWRFLDEKEAGFSMSIYPQFEFDTPGESHADRNLSENGNSLILPVQAVQALGPASLNGELGYTLKKGSPDEFLYGFAVGYDVSDRLELLGEVFGTITIESADHDIVLNLGARYKLADQYVLLFSFGRGIFNSQGDEAKVLSYSGIQFLF